MSKKNILRIIFLTIILVAFVILFLVAENRADKSEKYYEQIEQDIKPLKEKKNLIEQEINSITVDGCGVIMLVVKGNVDIVYEKVYSQLNNYGFKALLVLPESDLSELSGEHLQDIMNSGWNCTYVVNELDDINEIAYNDEVCNLVFTSNQDITENIFDEEQWTIRMMSWNKNGVTSFVKNALNKLSVIALEISVDESIGFDSDLFISMLDTLKSYVDGGSLKILLPSEAIEFVEAQNQSVEEQKKENDARIEELNKQLKSIQEEINTLYNKD